jgi:hypothetical protein
MQGGIQMKQKIYYIIFRVIRVLKTRGTRIYLGKQVTNAPKNTYLGENDSRGMLKALNSAGGNRSLFKKEIVKFCETEEEMHSEHARMVKEALEKYSWKYYNKLEENVPYKRDPESLKKRAETLRRLIDEGKVFNPRGPGHKKPYSNRRKTWIASSSS